MLSYRHHYHAGNFADLLKYFSLFLVLNYQNQKQTPYLYLDTHAGAGLYLLDEKNQEFKEGEGIFLAQKKIKMPELAEFRDFLIKNQKQGSVLGSVLIAGKLLRETDTLRACELHPSDFPKLKQNLSFRKKRTIIEQEDGFKKLIAVLPPPSKRAVILIDPPYEIKSDYLKIIKSLELALKKFPQAVILVWYPFLTSLDAQNLPKNLDKLSKKLKIPALNVGLKIKAPPEDGFGMFGSGVFIFNPPYILEDILNRAVPVISKLVSA